MCDLDGVHRLHFGGLKLKVKRIYTASVTFTPTIYMCAQLLALIILMEALQTKASETSY